MLVATDDPLTAEQTRALESAQAAHAAFVSCSERTAERRDRAIQHALEVGCPRQVLAERLGVSHGRVSQIASRLGVPSARKNGNQ